MSLIAATNYWIVIQSDDSYKDDYVDGGAGSRFLITFRRETPVPGGYAARRWDGAAWQNDTYMLSFNIGGLDPDHFYDYKITYVNNDYNSESRPTEVSEIMDPGFLNNRVTISLPSTLDPQADGCNIYRRDRGTDETIAEDDVTGFYYYVGFSHWSSAFVDFLPDANVGARLHSEDHYCYDDVDDTDQGKRDSALMPAGWVLWKGRIWFWEAQGRIFYFSKVFERNNTMGLGGESSPDYFPLDNRLAFPVTSAIINAKALSNDQMAIYFEDETIIVLAGADSPLNPPSPPDMPFRPMFQTIGLFAPNAVIPYGGTNIYVAREGLYRFSGLGGFAPELLSETQGGILDAIENQYFDDSLIFAYGRELWLVIDSDNDGDLDMILILDLEREFRTRTIVDRTWRTYEYPVAINDIVAVNVGDEFRQLLAADATAGWIMELNDGDTDNGAAIVGEDEWHDITAPNNAFIYQIDIDGDYTDTSNMPTIDLSVSDDLGNEATGTLTPTGNGDIRGQRMQLRMKGPRLVRAKVEMTSTKRDKIRGVTVSYDRE